MTVGPRVLFAGVLLGLAGCGGGPTTPTLADIERAQAEWTAHHLTRYAYRLEETGFFTALAGQPMRLVVLGDTVRSAQFVPTGDSVPVDPSSLPTIDALFALAVAAQDGGELVAVEFDSTFAYPTRIEVSGLPDASGVFLASNIELLP